MADASRTPPPPAFHDGVSDAESASALWRYGQDLADRLDRRAEAEQDEKERERLGDLADALRGI